MGGGQPSQRLKGLVLVVPSSLWKCRVLVPCPLQTPPWCRLTASNVPVATRLQKIFNNATNKEKRERLNWFPSEMISFFLVRVRFFLSPQKPVRPSRPPAWDWGTLWRPPLVRLGNPSQVTMVGARRVFPLSP